MCIPQSELSRETYYLDSVGTFFEITSTKSDKLVLVNVFFESLRHGARRESQQDLESGHKEDECKLLITTGPALLVMILIGDGKGCACRFDVLPSQWLSAPRGKSHKGERPNSEL